MKVETVIDLFLGLPKTVFLNFRLLPVGQALKLPIWCTHRTMFKSLKGNVVINSPIKTGMIRFGFGGSGTAKYYSSVIENNGKIVFNGKSNFGGYSTVHNKRKQLPYNWKQCDFYRRISYCGV